MEEYRIAHDHVAPLLIRKATPDVTEEQDGQPRQESNNSANEEADVPRPRFQNFLRASYPFQPTATPSPSTVTLGLNAGDIVLVHSIHTNGWADGTLLETGARGWLPTNYCEPYDYATMRPLLKAVTEFWDVIRSGNETNAGLFNNHDYMRGMVAGVRFLLEKSDCLTRDSRLVKKHDSIRKIRKALLADLSNLVKAAKQLHQLVVAGSQLSDIDELLDEMLLKAFQVVTRAVGFFDCWSEEAAFSRETVNAESFSPIKRRTTTDSRLSKITTTTLSSDYTTRQHSLQSFSDEVPPSLSQGPVRRRTLTHRMSYGGRPPQLGTNKLASEKLNAMYDGFLGVLASFLGSHMQSRSSSELLLTTQQAVKACKGLLNVIEAVVAHDLCNCESLIAAKDAMYDKITELVLAAKQVFRPAHATDEEMIYLPSEGMQLVSAATACVSGAGRCVAKARVILEEIGDFELEVSPDSKETSPVEAHGQPIPAVDQSENVQRPTTKSDDLLIRPRLEITTAPGELVPSEKPGSASNTGVLWTPIISPGDDSPLSMGSPMPERFSSSSILSPQTQARFSRSFMRDVVHSTASESTLVSSARDSGPSFVSDTSTRATSPDRSLKPLPSTPQNEEYEAEEDIDDDEQNILEQHYAHELMFNGEGRVIGGSLNAVIERLTTHDSTPDAFFVSTIYLTFRLFTTPQKFAEALSFRFHYIKQTPRIAGPVQLRVFNIVKGWLESHWRRDCDEPVLPYLTDFVTQTVLPDLPAAGQRLLELIDVVTRTHQPPNPRVLSTIGKTSTSSTDYILSDQPLPQPLLSKSQLSALKSWRTGGTSISILDFDPLEIARQITIKESGLFCSILPEELLSTEFTKQSSSLAVNVRAMAQLSTDIANLVADSVLQLEEPKKRAATIKQWIKVANKCLELNNYDTMMAIICSINSSTILRLKKTWDLVNQKTNNCFEGLKKVVDVSKNYSTLRQRISGHVPPCLPFVGMYLTDLTFVDHGNPATRELKTGSEAIPVINLDKHMKTAKIISDLQRFQIPYRLIEVSELQTWLQDELVRVRATGERNFQNHYRRSLILEPRESAQARPATLSTFASFTGQKDKFDFLNWAHIGREKTTTVSS